MAPAKANKVATQKPANNTKKRGKENYQPVVRVVGPPANRGDENFSSKRSYGGQTAFAKKSKPNFSDEDEANDDTPKPQDPPQPEDREARQAAGVDGEDSDDDEAGREVK
jgi:hypothetical protein